MLNSNLVYRREDQAAMNKDKKTKGVHDAPENPDSKSKKQDKDVVSAVENQDNSKQAEPQKDDNEVEALKAQLESKSKQCEEYFGALQRSAAEFDNYKKRTAREKENLYVDASSDVVGAFLPVIDNLERAVQASNKDDVQSLKGGVELVLRQIKDVLKNLGVEEIESVGKNFDPQLHNAVMHIEDDSYGENVVVEEFQKGYMLKDKIIRHSMIKAAN